MEGFLVNRTAWVDVVLVGANVMPIVKITCVYLWHTNRPDIRTMLENGLLFRQPHASVDLDHGFQIVLMGCDKFVMYPNPECVVNGLLQPTRGFV